MNEITPETRALLLDAARWRLLGLLFERPRDGWSDAIHALANDADDEPLQHVVRLADEQASESLYLAVIGQGGEASPREVAYRGFADPGQILAELAAFYDAFAYEPVAEDPPDHVAIETGFVGYLTLKQAFARAAGDAEAEAIAAEAATEFRREHLALIAAALEEKIIAFGDTYIAVAAHLLKQRVGFAPPVPIVQTADEEGDFGCGVSCPA